MTLDSSATVNKIAQLSEETKKLREELYEKFRKFTLVKAQLMGEAIEALAEKNYTYDEMKTESKRDNIFEEYLLLNYGTETLPDWQYVYKVEAKGEKTEDGKSVIKEVQGYWMKTVLDRVT